MALLFWHGAHISVRLMERLSLDGRMEATILTTVLARIRWHRQPLDVFGGMRMSWASFDGHGLVGMGSPLQLPQAV